jgi:cytoskeleton protein RodZ
MVQRGNSVTSQDIGAILREMRLGQGLTIADISRDTRISSRFLEAIESDNFESLPGNIFARNFVRQYALAVNLDPEPLLAQLPKQDDIRLPDPPARFSYRTETMRSAFSSGIWLVFAAGAATAAYLHFNHSGRPRTPHAAASVNAAAPIPNPPPAPVQAAVTPVENALPTPAAAVPEHPVRVVITASQSAWIQVSADGKTAFTGTLAPSETKEISADAQVKITTGNAGALTLSLNGKTLEPLGPVGQVRVVRLTAEGPEFLPKAPPPPDPL